MEFKGTKGKWIVRYEKNSNGFINIDLPNKLFITIYGELKKINDVFPEETKANALLISKAPEMLEMLKKCKDAMLELMEHQDGWEKDYEELEKLIKEATEL